MASIASHEEFRIGRVIDLALGCIRRNLPMFAALTLVLSGLPTAATYLAFGGVPGTTAGFELSWGLGVAWLLSLLGGALLQAAMIRMTVVDLNGGRPSFGDALGTAVQLVLPVIALTFIVIVAAAIGAMLLVVPGIMIYMMWSLAIPVLVEERAGIGGSLSRSRSLTKGARWKLFGLIAIAVFGVLLLQMLASFVVGIIGGAAAGGTGAVIAIMGLNFIASLLFGMFFATTMAVAYVELRRTKEGVSVDQLAEVFA